MELRRNLTLFMTLRVYFYLMVKMQALFSHADCHMLKIASRQRAMCFSMRSSVLIELRIFLRRIVMRLSNRIISLVLSIVMIVGLWNFSGALVEAKEIDLVTTGLTQAESIVSAARGEVGNCFTKDNKYTYWYYGYHRSEDWCAIFVSWCAEQAGVASDIVPRLAGAHSNFDWFNSRGLWHGKKSITWTYNGVTRSSTNDSSYVPQAGDIILRETYGGVADGPDHVELVTGSDGSRVYTIGGNTGGYYSNGVYYSNVKEKSYSLWDTDTWGYCTPAYTDISDPDPLDLGLSFYAFIINSSMWKHLTVEQNNNVVIRSEKSDLCADQVWKFERQSDNSYKIISTANGECLDVDNAARESGTNVKTCIDNGNDAQRWFIFSNGNNYILKSKCSDCVLDITGGNSSDGTNVQMYAQNNTVSQDFTIYQLGDRSFVANLGDDFTAPILNLKAWITIENSDDGNISLQKETGKSNQLWRFRRQIDGSYKIYSCYDGKCIDLDNAAYENGTNIKICGSNDNDAQRWYFYEYGGGYTIQSKSSGKLFDVAGGSLNYGTNIQAWEWNGTDAQVFAVYRGNECMLGPVFLTAESGKGNVTLNWTSTYGETAYVLKLWQGTVSEGEPYLVKNDIPARSRSVTLELPSGYYEGYILSQNYFESYTSNTVGFAVEEKPTETPTIEPTEVATETPTEAPTEVPTVQLTEVPTEPIAEYILGDADGDGVVTILDATVIQRYLAAYTVKNPDTVVKCGDIAGDGLDIIDATLIQRFLAEFTVPYDIGQPTHR